MTMMMMMMMMMMIMMMMTMMIMMVVRCFNAWSAMGPRLKPTRFSTDFRDPYLLFPSRDIA